MRPVADHYDRTQETPWDVMQAAADEGLYGLEYIQSMGSDAGGLYGVIYAEETHWGCAGIALAISASGLAAAGIASSGTPDQIAQWVPECFRTADDVKLGVYCVAEAGAGSDVEALRTTAKRAGDAWVTNGMKVFTSTGGIADVNAVVAPAEPALGRPGRTSLTVPKDTPGLSAG